MLDRSGDLSHRTGEWKGKREERAHDLFSGTHSVARAMRNNEFEVTTVDSDGGTQPHICEDVLNWDFMFFS